MSLQDGSDIHNIPANLTINSIVYVPENVQLTTPTNSNKTYNKDMAPSSTYHAQDLKNGSVTLLMTDAAQVPVIGANGVFAYDFGGGSDNFKITEVGQAYAQGQAYKVTIKFEEAISLTPPI